mmetsp:Transcript_44239/g.60417  ORF Transcript_44239/g.60417 Transcript_44239/m.60417 type:complete len:120 (+) Transcript_44239:991-1350(+)
MLHQARGRRLKVRLIDHRQEKQHYWWREWGWLLRGKGQHHGCGGNETGFRASSSPCPVSLATSSSLMSNTPSGDGGGVGSGAHHHHPPHHPISDEIDCLSRRLQSRLLQWPWKSVTEIA